MIIFETISHSGYWIGQNFVNDCIFFNDSGKVFSYFNNNTTRNDWKKDVCNNVTMHNIYSTVKCFRMEEEYI